MDVIKTSLGTGSPGYMSDKAPGGEQWQNAKGDHLKVPDGTHVKRVVGHVNTNQPPYCEVLQLDGLYTGISVWVKSTHVVSESGEEPVDPPVDDMVPGKLYKVEHYVKLVEVKE